MPSFISWSCSGFVQSPVTAIQRFDKTVLHWFTGGDVVPPDEAGFLPLHKGIRGKLGSIFADKHAGVTSGQCNAVQFPCHPFGGERVAGSGGKALSTEFINHAQDTELPAIAEASEMKFRFQR